LREHVWLPVHGTHYAFKDITVHVIEDDAHCRWVCLADVRRAVGVEANERALAATYAGCLQSMGKPAQIYMRDDALIAHLGKNKELAVLKFKAWVERNVAFPGQKLRKDRR
jgi:predicted nucleotidyltransferase